MHREETAQQIGRLEQVLEIFGKCAKAEKCEGIDGILEEGEGLRADFGQTKAGDAAIIFSWKAVEHYENTRYGSMHTYASELGEKEVAALLQPTLYEENTTDKN